MSNIVCHLFVPGLNADGSAAAAHFGYSVAELPLALRRLTSRGDIERLPSSDPSTALLHAHGFTEPAARGAAALMARGDGINTDNTAWLRADPVHLRIEQDRLVLHDAEFLNLTHDEASALSEMLNIHFAEDGLEFVVANAQRWYMRLASSPAIVTAPLDAVLGQDVHRYLPRGAEAMLWHRRYNELQMLLHNHPVNQAREARGALPANSVWWWGEGEERPVSARFARLAGDEPLLRGLAISSGTPYTNLPDSANAWLAEAPEEGEHFIVLQGLRRPWAYRLNTEWQSTLGQLEHSWFAPLLAALAGGRISAVKISALTSDSHASYRITRPMLWRFWR